MICNFKFFIHIFIFITYVTYHTFLLWSVSTCPKEIAPNKIVAKLHSAYWQFVQIVKLFLLLIYVCVDAICYWHFSTILEESFYFVLPRYVKIDSVQNISLTLNFIDRIPMVVIEITYDLLSYENLYFYYIKDDFYRKELIVLIILRVEDMLIILVII